MFTNEKQLKGHSLIEAFNCYKIVRYLWRSSCDLAANSKELNFKASRGCLERIKKKWISHGEATSSDKKEAEKPKKEFSDIIKAEGFVSQHVFNGDDFGKSCQIEFL